ncbi:MAG: hypothetical protein IKW48_09190 [Akkermansia sp.]|nr:hypothetical protein [Akkermansia sp.]
MNTRLFHIISLTATAAMLCSCGNVTGDPRQGGLFGWSEAEAKRQLEQLKAQETAKMQELQQLQKTGESLLAKQARLLREIKKLQEQAAETTQTEARARLNAEIEKRKQELSIMGE